jgi:hypothetical protein
MAPPTATFKLGFSATEDDVAEGPALSNRGGKAPPAVARMKLTAVLGEPTVAVHSGGVYTGATGDEDRLHLHWRLKEPTTTVEEHAQAERVPAAGYIDRERRRLGGAAGASAATGGLVASERRAPHGVGRVPARP